MPSRKRCLLDGSPVNQARFGFDWSENGGSEIRVDGLTVLVRHDGFAPRALASLNGDDRITFWTAAAIASH